MENLQQATEKICDLKGNVLALEAFIAALIRTLPASALPTLQGLLTAEAEAARTMLLHEVISEHTISAFERDIQRLSTSLTRAQED